MTTMNDINNAIKFANSKDEDERNLFEGFLGDWITDNYYKYGAKLKFGRQEVEIESLWVDGDGRINVHVCSKHFEGDLYLTSLNKRNILVVLNLLKEHFSK